MFFGFEGTGMQKWGGTSSWGVNNWEGTTSNVWKFYQNSTAPSGLKRYFPGPNLQGSNCDDILVQAKDHYRELKRSYGSAINNQKITLVGYSRGAYMAMCFAKFLQINGVSVHFMGLFDAVSVDASVEAIISTERVPTNVKTCYHACRSAIIGSRNTLMNYVGREWENGGILKTLKEFPGSHSALGGFPNDAGKFDGPILGQGDPKKPDQFHPGKEITAWYEAVNHVATPAIQAGVLRVSWIPTKPHGWIPRDQWYKAHPVTPRKIPQPVYK